MSPPDTLARFSPAERFAHRGTALLVLVLTVTGFTLLYPPLSLLVGRRPLVEGVHVAAGVLLPLPTLVALATRQFRADLAALNRFSSHDWAWLRRRGRRRAGLLVGKFNAGQKLAAAAVAAAGVLLLGTGVMLLLPDPLGLTDNLRQGATIVHDATTLALVALLVGHTWLALRHPEARVAMRTGSMDAEYARAAYAGWAAEQGGARDG